MYRLDVLSETSVVPKLLLTVWASRRPVASVVVVIMTLQLGRNRPGSVAGDAAVRVNIRRCRVGVLGISNDFLLSLVVGSISRPLRRG